MKVQILVVDDELLAAAIGRLSAEWEARSDDRFEVANASIDQLRDDQLQDFDLLIYPSRYLGLLVERSRLVPIRSNILRSKEYDFADIFDSVRRRETVWGERPFALPFGGPVFVLYYRSDLFEKVGTSEPKTWRDYANIVAQLAEASRSGKFHTPDGWVPSIEPLADGWAGLALLARAASYAKHPDNYSGLFSIDTMQPLIDGPPFLRALRELHDIAGSIDMPRFDPNEARRAVHEGRCAMAITWPTAAAERENKSQDLGKVRISPLPGSREVYDVSTSSWKTRDEYLSVPLVGLAGCLGSVSAGSKNVPAALRLLAWLTGPEIGTRVGAASRSTSMFRCSQINASASWVEEGLDMSVARKYADHLAEALEHQNRLRVPRIPGSDEYLRILDGAVGQVLFGKAEAGPALQEVATRWQTVSKQHGLDVQRKSYRRSLGLDSK